jgi:hypothetical protein
VLKRRGDNPLGYLIAEKKSDAGKSFPRMQGNYFKIAAKISSRCRPFFGKIM